MFSLLIYMLGLQFSFIIAGAIEILEAWFYDI